MGPWNQAGRGWTEETEVVVQGGRQGDAPAAAGCSRQGRPQPVVSGTVSAPKSSNQKRGRERPAVKPESAGRRRGTAERRCGRAAAAPPPPRAAGRATRLQRRRRAAVPPRARPDRRSRRSRSGALRRQLRLDVLLLVHDARHVARALVLARLPLAHAHDRLVPLGQLRKGGGRGGRLG